MAGSSARVGGLKVGGAVVAAPVVAIALAEAMSAAPAAAVSMTGSRRRMGPPWLNRTFRTSSKLDGPAAGALDRPLPSGVTSVRASARGGRSELALEGPLLGHLGRRAPHAFAETGQIGGAERRRLLNAGSGHGHAELVSLELEQHVHDGCSAVGSEGSHLVPRCGGHRLHHVAGLVRHGLHHGPGNVGPA